MLARTRIPRYALDVRTLALSAALALASCCFGGAPASPPPFAPLPGPSPVASDPRRTTLASAESALGRGDYASALLLADQLVAQLGPSPDAALEGDVRGVRGTALSALGRFDEAIPELERARALELQVGDREGILVATHELASALDYAERHAEAEQLFRDLVSRRRELHGAESTEAALALVNLAVCLELQDRVPEAGSVAREALTMLEARGATGNGAYEVALNTLGNERREAHDLEAALTLYQRTLAAREARLGPTHPDLGIPLHNIATTALELDRSDEALAAIDRALAVRQAALPADHPWLVEDRALRETILATRAR